MMKLWTTFGLLVLMCGIGVGGLSAFAPPDPPAWALIASDGLCLEIGSAGHFKSLALPKFPTVCTEEVVARFDVRLTNHRSDDRPLVGMILPHNRLGQLAELTYVCRLSDGNLFVIRSESTSVRMTLDDHRTKAQPLTIPGGNQLTDHVNALGDRMHHRFCGYLLQHKTEQFCVSAVIEKLGLQSNLIRFNGCPAPPRDYCPLNALREDYPAQIAAEKAFAKEEHRRRFREHFGREPVGSEDVSGEDLDDVVSEPSLLP